MTTWSSTNRTIDGIFPGCGCREWLDWAVGDAVDIGRAPGSTACSSTTSTVCWDAGVGETMAIGYVRRVAESTGATMYVNRAFPILDSCPAVEAVLVEDVDRDLALRVGTWLRRGRGARPEACA